MGYTKEQKELFLKYIESDPDTKNKFTSMSFDEANKYMDKIIPMLSPQTQIKQPSTGRSGSVREPYSNSIDNKIIKQFSLPDSFITNNQNQPSQDTSQEVSPEMEESQDQDIEQLSPLVDKYTKLAEQNKSKPWKGILDSVISGLLSVGSDLAGDRDASNSIMQGLSQRQGERDYWNKGYKKDLMSAYLKKIGTEDTAQMKNFKFMKDLKDDNERTMFMQMGINPFQIALSKMFDNDNY